MSYYYKYNNYPMYWVSYRGTGNGSHIRASSHKDAKWIYAKGEGLKDIVYLQSKKA